MVESAKETKPFTLRLAFQGQCIPMRLSEASEETKEAIHNSEVKSLDLFETFENVDIDKMTCEDIVSELKQRRDFSENGV